ncbi:MAG TPA: DegT/DnrJ/EryC1/StrS family aminotransferase [Chlamydiales bacterium]|nr:DegT/DnrJ/EryC1/StrS family aminotransferase [Chlamydiales bacterium]
MIEYENLARVNAPFGDEFRRAFDRLLLRGRFILGDETAKFEEEFAAYVGTRFCVGISSGLDALRLALMALDFPPGKEVLVPSNTYIATLLAILHNGLVPVLVEPNLSTYNLDVEGLEAKLTDRTVAILPVHLYGKLSPMVSILRFAKANGLKVVEDCAQAHGASYLGKKAGSFGDINAFSFYPTKNLGALGDGGAITTDDPLLFEKVCLMRNYGSKGKNHHEIVGYNHRLDELQAAFLRIKLKRLDEINRHKAKLAALYLRYLPSDLILPVVENGYEDVWHIFAIRHPDRDGWKSYLQENQIETMIHYPIPPHKQKALQGKLQEELFPLSEEIHRTILSLPCSFMHSEEEILRVIETTKGRICSPL